MVCDNEKSKDSRFFHDWWCPPTRRGASRPVSYTHLDVYKRQVLGVTGGVAAYKAAELVRLLVKAGAEVDVVLTAAGAQFVGAATFQALTGRRVWQALWDERMDNGMAHIELTRGAAALLVAPAMNRQMWENPCLLYTSRCV